MGTQDDKKDQSRRLTLMDLPLDVLLCIRDEIDEQPPAPELYAEPRHALERQRQNASLRLVSRAFSVALAPDLYKTIWIRKSRLDLLLDTLVGNRAFGGEVRAVFCLHTVHYTAGATQPCVVGETRLPSGRLFPGLQKSVQLKEMAGIGRVFSVETMVDSTVAKGNEEQSD